MKIQRDRVSALKGMRTDIDPRFLDNDEALLLQNWDITGEGKMLVPRAGARLVSPNSGAGGKLPGEVIYTFWFTDLLAYTRDVFIGVIVRMAGSVIDRIYVRNLTGSTWTRKDKDTSSNTDLSLAIHSPRWQAVKIARGVVLVYEQPLIQTSSNTGSDNAIYMDSVNVVPLTGTFVYEPTSPRYVEFWGGRIFVADPVRGSAALLYTAIGSIGFVSPNGSANSSGTIGIDGMSSEEISGLLAYKDRLYIFKRSSIFVLYAANTLNGPYDQTQFEVKKIENSIGCVSGNSIRILKGKMIWLSDKGVCVSTLSPFITDSLDISVHNNIPELFVNADYSTETALQLHGNYNAAISLDRQQYWLTGLGK